MLLGTCKDKETGIDFELNMFEFGDEEESENENGLDLFGGEMLKLSATSISSIFIGWVCLLFASTFLFSWLVDVLEGHEN